MAKNLHYILEDYFSNKDLNEQEKKKVNDEIINCILIAQSPVITRPFTSYSKNLPKFLKLTNHSFDLETLFKEQLKGKRFIELGPGARPLADWAFQYGISEYIGVEPFNPEITKENLSKDPRVKLEKDKEALEFLLSQEDESAIVLSMGVLCEELFRFNNDNYFRFIIKEIYRITPKNAPSIHLIGPINHHLNYFIENSFKPVTDLKSNMIYIK